jgi:hypothetical protein
MSDDGLLREKALRAILAGTLPESRPERIWGGKGGGAPCAICDEPVKPDENEVELEIARESSTDGYHFHVRCFMAWDGQRQALEPAR